MQLFWESFFEATLLKCVDKFQKPAKSFVSFRNNIGFHRKYEQKGLNEKFFNKNRNGICGFVTI
ncbi:MAG: hypothetical protein DSZ30_02880 [Aquificaceae bacterium]|nr:MAG: hypothetical protein DSZ30_02880 [Aquificaceae bacterium]